MEHKLSKLNKVRQITLTAEERAYLRAHLAHVVSSPLPITISDSLFQRGVQHGLRIALSSFLFVVFVGGTISAVASNALPGDPLYSVKVDFNERVKGLLLKSPEEKVAWQQTRVENRVNEIKTLAETKTLTTEKQKKAQKALDENVSDLSKELSSLSDKSPSSALSVTASLEEKLKLNKEAIESTLTDGSTTEHEAAAAQALKAVDGTLEKVSQQEVKILSKEIDNITDEANATDTSATGDDASPSDDDTSVVDESIDASATGGTDSGLPTPPPITPAGP